MVVGGVGFDGGIASGDELGASAESLKFRVRSVVDLSGEVHLSAQNAASTRKDGKPEIARRAAVRSVSTLDYDEHYEIKESESEWLGYQYFHEATSEITVDRHETRTALRDNSRELVRLSTASGLTVAGLSSPLFSAERELVQGSIDSMYLDGLLTDREVAISDKWMVDRAVVAKLFHLDAVLEGDLTVCLVDLDEQRAHLEMKGELQASVRDVPTRMQIEGKGEDRSCCSISLTWDTIDSWQIVVGRLIGTTERKRRCDTFSTIAEWLSATSPTWLIFSRESN